ncbi:branched-chain amino acid ABC transporter permease [Pusillimonas noertemannii]|uniref:branched-chain amino acid ABC transporter permease n=1 Tax=Pusillimonas noertemannii TaxID=305977 RepID=UPI0002F536DC|nr:branched-chain amino acid ABC transporter permease [Pusillimonas noertemannii]
MTPAAVHDALRDKTRIKVWEPVLWLVPLAVVALFPGSSFLVNQMAIMALFAISLDLVLGYAGIMSLGHAAFFGMGAFAAGLFAKFVMPEPIAGLVFAMAVGGISAYLCSYTILRGSELTIVMVTLGVSLILFEVGNYMTWLTGGADGLQGVVMAPVLGLFPFTFDGVTAAYYSLVVLAVFLVVYRRIVNSPFGTGLRLIRDNRLRASAIGIDTDKRIKLAYTLAGAIAAAAGAVQTHSMNFASLDAFAFERSADVLLMVVIGGTAWIYGGVVGAVVFIGLHHVLSDLTPQYWTFWVGVFLVLLMRVGRDRLVRPWTWLKGGPHG